MGKTMDFSTWYTEQQPAVSGVMLALTGDRQLAEDVTNEAFARAWSKWSSVEAMDSPSGWVYRVALNVLRRHLRRRTIEEAIFRREHQRKAIEPTPLPDEVLWAKVRELPERQRNVLVLRYVADLPEQQIADLMKIRRGTVAATLSAARERLLTQIKEQGHE